MKLPYLFNDISSDIAFCACSVAHRINKFKTFGFSRLASITVSSAKTDYLEFKIQEACFKPLQYKSCLIH